MFLLSFLFRGLQQSLLKFIGPIQTHAYPFNRETVFLQNRRLQQTVHRSVVAKKAREDIQTLDKQFGRNTTNRHANGIESKVSLSGQSHDR